MRVIPKDTLHEIFLSSHLSPTNVKFLTEHFFDLLTIPLRLLKSRCPHDFSQIRRNPKYRRPGRVEN